jgi:hypothetical protein
VALPIAAYLRRFQHAAFLIAVVLVEVRILATCALMAIAARYTSDRSANFDIYLPRWIARYNKEIFGSLFAVGLSFTLVRCRFT